MKNRSEVVSRHAIASFNSTAAFGQMWSTWWEDSEGVWWPGWLADLVSTPELKARLRERKDMLNRPELVPFALEMEHRVTPIESLADLKVVFDRLESEGYFIEDAEQLCAERGAALRAHNDQAAAAIKHAQRLRDPWPGKIKSREADVAACHARRDNVLQEELLAKGLVPGAEENLKIMKQLLPMRRRRIEGQP